MTLIRIKTRHRQVFSKWWNSNTPSNIGLQFYSVSTTVMKSFCKKPLLDVVLKSQVVVRFLRYWSKKGIMYHVLISCHNIVTTQFWHSSLGIRCCHCWRRPQWTGGCKLPCKMWCEDCCAGEEACPRWEVNKDMLRSKSKQALHQHQPIKISGSRRCCCHWGDCSRIQIFQSKLCS